MKDRLENSLDLTVEIAASHIEAAYPLLQQGVRIEVESGSSIEDLLCETIGVSREYIEEKVQTIFLNGKAVDDLGKTVLVEGSRIALSAAMPGLAGALMRRGGFFASMRSGISYRPESVDKASESCFVTVLLFNMLVREIGPQFMKHGVWITVEELAKLVKRMPDAGATSVRIRVKGNELDVKKVLTDDSLSLRAEVFVKIMQKK